MEKQSKEVLENVWFFFKKVVDTNMYSNYLRAQINISESEKQIQGSAIDAYSKINKALKTLHEIYKITTIYLLETDPNNTGLIKNVELFRGYVSACKVGNEVNKQQIRQIQEHSKAFDIFISEYYLSSVAANESAPQAQKKDGL